MPLPALRLRSLPPYPFALLTQRVRELNAQGFDVIGLDIGSPDLPPPEHVVEALERSARHPGHHGYSGYKGTASFRDAVARYYASRFNVTIDPDRQVLPLIGSKEGIVNLGLAYMDTGDIALMPDIGYPSYAQGAHMAGGHEHLLPIRESGGYLIDFDAISPEIASKAKLLWLNYPHNPTGATAELDFYQRAVDFCAKYDILLASDNPYVDVTFDGYRASSVLECEGAVNSAVEFMSFSKTFNMAGWRLGAAVGSAEAIKMLLQVKSNIDSGHFHAIYDAGIAALDQTPRTWLEQRNAVYQRRRDRILDVLPQIGLRALRPKGSLYVWAEVVNKQAADYVEQALLNAHVSIAPGEIYGPGGRSYVRLSVGISDERLEQALERLKSWYTSR